MTFLNVYLVGLALIVAMVTLLWIYSVIIKNASIVDVFWGFGFVVTNFIYLIMNDVTNPRQWLLVILVSVWGIRLSGYIGWRNYGKEEDFRYQKFREDYGAHRYWWVSYFQVFLLQGLLMWLISAPLLATHFYSQPNSLNLIDLIALIVWLIGFVFEAGGDWQLANFKAKPENKGKVLNTGFWHYTRHPNYFGDATVWVAYALFSVASGSYLPVLGSLLMIGLIIKVSGVAMLERTLKETKPAYKDYIEKTNSFFPWFPRK